MESTEVVIRRRFRKRWIALALIVILGLVLTSLWTQRKQIAGGYIDEELARRGVQARYEIADLAFGRQRLEHVVIGDPAHPDLTADWVELRLSYGLRVPRVSRITARGVRLYGRIVDGKLSLGQIDRLLAAPTGAPFSLPNVAIDIADAAMRLDTPAGRVAVAVLGQGNLTGGFRGRALALSRRLSLGGCAVEAPVAALAISISGRKPSLLGPVRGDRLSCGDGIVAEAPLLDLNATLDRELDAWVGNARLRLASARSGSDRVGAVDGRFSFGGDAALTRGTLVLAATDGRFGDLSSARLLFNGRYEASATTRQALADGEAVVTALVAAGGAVRPVTAPLRSTDGTPLEPFGRALGAAFERAANGLNGRAHLTVLARPAGTLVQIMSLDALSRSGARLILADGAGLTISGAGIDRIDGRFALSGGGFPTLEAVLSQASAGSPVNGNATMSPFTVGAARLALAPISFAGRPDGLTRIATAATIDGPFNGGQVRALMLPISGWFGRGSFAFGEQCTPLSFQAFRYGTLVLGPTRLGLCPVGRGLVWQAGSGGVQGGAEVRGMRLAGRLGSSPFAYTTDRFRLDLARGGFTSSKVAVRLGSADYVNRLDLAGLSGRFTARGLEGDFTGGSGKIANVPLLFSQAKGRWQVVGAKASVDSRVTVADEADPARFHPLRSDDFHLTLAGNRIDVAGWLNDPETGTRVTRATIVHALDTGRGRAELDVPGIAFNEAFQPDQLTRLTIGVIALVKGEVKGKGEIAWGPEGTTSSGTFSTTGTDLAAPFGPVTGMTTTIRFTDLLGLETGPDQQVAVDRIQAGIDVFDGVGRYQLLPGLKVRVQAGSWPFAGGRLELDETVLDFSQDSEKHLTFRVEGMDAASFVEQMQFSNIAATGTFDGIVPMVFDNRGGRIVRGHLTARPAGGTVSYVGELTEADLGAYGKLAFDALKSLRYSKLVVTLDGALEGEFVAGVELDGVARNAPNPGGITGMALRQLAKIPFEFNITARGPFRAIIGTMRSMKDPSGLIQAVLPSTIRDQPTTLTVQPKESETVQ